DSGTAANYGQDLPFSTKLADALGSFAARRAGKCGRPERCGPWAISGDSMPRRGRRAQGSLSNHPSARAPVTVNATPAVASPAARHAAPVHSSQINLFGLTGSRPITDRKNPAGI